MTDASDAKGAAAPDRRFFLAGALIVLLAAYLRLHDLDTKSLWLDELLQIRVVKLGLAEMWHALTIRDQHPPLSYIIQKMFTLYTDSDYMYRLPSALFGIGAVWLSLYFCRKIIGAFPALVAGLLLAVNTGAITQAQYVRPYSLLLFAAVFNYGIVFSIINGHRFRRQIFWLTASSTLALYADTFGIAVAGSSFMALAIHLLVAKHRKKESSVTVREILISLTITFLLYLPWLIAFTSQFGRTVQMEIDWTLKPTPRFFGFIFNYFYYGIWKNYGQLFSQVPFYVFLALIICGSCRPKSFKLDRLLLGGMVIGIPLVAFFICVKAEVFAPRHFIFLLFPSVMLIACAADGLVNTLAGFAKPNRHCLLAALRSIILLLVIIGCAPRLRDYYNDGHHLESYKGDWKGILNFVLTEVGENERVYLHNKNIHIGIFDYYLRRQDRPDLMIERIDSLEELAHKANEPGRNYVIISIFDQPKFFKKVSKMYVKGRHYLQWSIYLFDSDFDLQAASATALTERGLVKEFDSAGKISFDASQADRFNDIIFGPKVVFNGEAAALGNTGGEARYFLLNRDAGDCRISVAGLSICRDNRITIKIKSAGQTTSLPYNEWGVVEAVLPCPRGIYSLDISFDYCDSDKVFLLRDISIEKTAS